MNRKTTIQLSVLVAAIGVVGVILWNANNEKTPEIASISSSNDLRREEGEQIAKADADAKRLMESSKIKLTPPPADRNGGGGTAANIPLPSYGQIRPVGAGVSPQALHATEAALSKTHPERLSCAFLPAAFDAKKWQEDADYRKNYLETPEPGRCYQSVQPTRDVPHIALASPAYVKTIQGQPVDLHVKATPGMPVTFTSFDAAVFTAGSAAPGSQLTTQTAVADAEGIASATLLAPPGVFDNCRVRASCPAASGAVVFTVYVALPEQSKPVASAQSPTTLPVPVSN